MLFGPLKPARWIICLNLSVNHVFKKRWNVPVGCGEILGFLPRISPNCSKSPPRISSLDSRPRKIVGKAGEEYFLLDPDEVLAFQADGDLVWIVTNKQRYLATQNLKTLEERLSTGSFRRIHRNALVNVNQIRKMSVITSQRWLITLNNGQEFIVSKRQARNVRDVLHW